MRSDVKSEPLQYYFLKNFYLVVLVILTIISDPFTNYKSFELEGWILYVAVGIILLFFHFLWNRRVYRAQLSKQGLVLKKGIMVFWTDVEYIDVTFLGIYKLKSKDGLLAYFPSSDLTISILGKRLIDDEMSEFIEKRRLEYGFS